MSDKAGDKYVPIEHTPAAEHDERLAAIRAGFEARVRDLVRAELAALGGHLLATYHGDPTPGAGDGRTYEPELATLAGYLLGEYGSDDAPDSHTSNSPDS